MECDVCVPSPPPRRPLALLRVPATRREAQTRFYTDWQPRRAVCFSHLIFLGNSPISLDSFLFVFLFFGVFFLVTAWYSIIGMCNHLTNPLLVIMWLVTRPHVGVISHACNDAVVEFWGEKPYALVCVKGFRMLPLRVSHPFPFPPVIQTMPAYPQPHNIGVIRISVLTDAKLQVCACSFIISKVHCF